MQAIRKASEYYNYCKKKNYLLQETHQLVLQKKIKIKQEFYIDVASYKNKHSVTAIGCYRKEGLSYLYLEQLNNTRHKAKLIEIANEVLHKLDVVCGLSHIEIAYTQDNQYKVIEYNPRVSGVHGYVNKMAKNNSGIDQIDAYLRLLNETPIIKQSKNLHQRLVILHQTFKDFTQLQSHYDYTPLESKESSEKDSLTQAKGLLMLTSKDLETIKKDTYKVLSKY